MKITILLSAAFVCTALLCNAQALGQPPVVHPMQGKPAMNEAAKHPNLADALKDLDNASMHLSKAPDEFGGHRAKAMELIKSAQAELRAALKSAAAQGK
jgi:hypothetical protein